jgi:hypothetical protein
MRLDKAGYPDVCRSVAAVLASWQVDEMDKFKLEINKLIDDLKDLDLPPDGKRYIALSITTLEEACMWITKAICTPQD